MTMLLGGSLSGKDSIGSDSGSGSGSGDGNSRTICKTF